MNEPQSPAEIFDSLLEYWELENDSQLSKHLEIDQRSLSQARKGKRIGIKDKIIIELLRDYAYMESKLQEVRKAARKD